MYKRQEIDSLSEADIELETDCDSLIDSLVEADSEFDTDCDSEIEALVERCV